jgi:hypothetical protein
MFRYIFLITVISLLSCTHKLPFNDAPSGVGLPCNPDSVYFQNSILPVLLSNCAMSGCHDDVSHQDDVILTSYAAVMNSAGVKPFKSSKSDLYEVLIETDPKKRMPPTAPLDADIVLKIKKWIDQGAMNNACTGCDTAGVMRYSLQITEIMRSNCNGCHSGSTPSDGIDLSSYAGVKAQVDNGKLSGSVNHTIGFDPMPKGGQKLSECQITSIMKWIADGAQNN